MTVEDAPRLHVTGQSRVMFIMADPVDHVIGTAVLKRAWSSDGRDLVYVPLHVRAEDLPFMLDAVRRAPNVAGTGITIPRKIAARDLVEHLTQAAKLSGAVNFIRRNTDGTLTGHNVDGAGFLAGLGAHDVDPAGRDIWLAGAGGVARAIAFALAGAGARSLTLRNRSADKAEALASALRDSAVGAQCRIGTGHAASADILVNGRSLGMRAENPLPFDTHEIPKGATVADVVMRPAVTALMQAAGNRGCRTISGHAMLDPQADLVATYLDGDPE